VFVGRGVIKRVTILVVERRKTKDCHRSGLEGGIERARNANWRNKNVSGWLRKHIPSLANIIPPYVGDQ
jgi:hypothetical protein